jgi:tetratricopeptide (TPR) repeat protein
MIRSNTAVPGCDSIFGVTDPISQQRLDELWDFTDAQKSERQLRAALAEASDPSIAGELTTQVARSLGLQDRFDEADALLDSIEDPTGVVAVRVLLERGRLRTSSDHLAEAVPLFEAALVAAAAEDLEFLEIDAAHMLVIAEPSKAEHWTARGLQSVSESTDRRTRRWGYSLRVNLGWRYFDDGNPAAALAEFQLAADAAAEYGTEAQRMHAQQAIDEARAELESELGEQ